MTDRIKLTDDGFEIEFPDLEGSPVIRCADDETLAQFLEHYGLESGE